MRSTTKGCPGVACFLLAAAVAAHFPVAAAPQVMPQRVIVADIAKQAGPVDHFFDLSVGSDFPGTLIRDDSQAQLNLVVEECGFRYIRFHGIFHDMLGTVRVENGKTVYNWSKIDQLYDDLLARNIKPFVGLGFTPAALATSENSIFYWKGNTSRPKPDQAGKPVYPGWAKSSEAGWGSYLVNPS